MTHSLSEAVNEKIEHARRLYHRLVLLVGEQGAGKTGALKEVAECTGATLVNVNLELSRRLLDLAERQRSRHVQHLLEEIAAGTGSAVVLLDNIELLFEDSLRQDPLRLLQHLSRRRTVVAAWNGSIEDGSIRYSEPGHPEYRHYPMEGILTVSAEAVT